LLPLYVGERVYFDGNKKAKILKKHHKSVWKQIEINNNQWTSKANKNNRCVIFEHLKPTRIVSVLSLNLVIWFRCIRERKNS
jgi:hypothetical protein